MLFEILFKSLTVSHTRSPASLPQCLLTRGVNNNICVCGCDVTKTLKVKLHNWGGFKTRISQVAMAHIKRNEQRSTSKQSTQQNSHLLVQFLAPTVLPLLSSRSAPKTKKKKPPGPMTHGLCRLPPPGFQHNYSIRGSHHHCTY